MSQLQKTASVNRYNLDLQDSTRLHLLYFQEARSEPQSAQVSLTSQ